MGGRSGAGPSACAPPICPVAFGFARDEVQAAKNSTYEGICRSIAGWFRGSRSSGWWSHSSCIAGEAAVTPPHLQARIPPLPPDPKRSSTTLRRWETSRSIYRRESPRTGECTSWVPGRRGHADDRGQEVRRRTFRQSRRRLRRAQLPGLSVTRPGPRPEARAGGDGRGGACLRIQRLWTGWRTFSAPWPPWPR
jgi:hypothetical protein